MKPSSKAFWGIAVLAGMTGSVLAAPGGLPVPAFEIIRPPRVALQPVQPRAMTRDTRGALDRLQRDGRTRDHRGVYGIAGGVAGIYDAAPTAIAGEPAPDPYVIPGVPPKPSCLGPGPLIIEVGRPLPAPTNLPRVVYGTPTFACPPGY